MGKLLLKISRHGNDEFPTFPTKTGLRKFITLLPVVDGEADWDVTEIVSGQEFTINFESRETLLEYLKYE